MTQGTGRAVVIGASMAGLIAARVLRDSYPHVVIVDRDRLPDGPTVRRGVPQGRHLHGLLVRGSDALDELFPGFVDDMVGVGAVRGDLQADLHWYIDGHLLKPAESGLLGIASSRPLLESVVRGRTAALEGIEFVDDCEVLGPLTSADRTRVTGVEIRPRSSGEVIALDAELVVDASGRGSRAPVWLRQLGYEPAPEVVMPVGTTYVTRVYRRKPEYLDGVEGVNIAAFPGSPRSAFLGTQEDDRLLLTTGGIYGATPPRDDDELVAFAETLPSPAVLEVVTQAELIEEPVTMRYPSSVRRRYDTLRRFPQGYVVVGDAVSSFNPVYGQGMTVAAVEGLLLRDVLAAGPHDVGRRFFRASAGVVGTAWDVSSGSDMRFPESEVRPPLAGRVLNRYLRRVYRAAAADPDVARTFLRVMNLIDAPSALMAPAIARRVLLAA